jgi:hypothetical protein
LTWSRGTIKGKQQEVASNLVFMAISSEMEEEVDEIELLSQYLSDVSQIITLFENHFANYVLLLDENSPNLDTQITLAMMALFRLGVINYILVIFSAQDILMTFTCFGVTIEQCRDKVFNREESYDSLFADRQRDLGGFVYRVGAPEITLYNAIVKDQNGLPSFIGIDAVILEIITRHQNASYEIVKLKTMTEGIKSVESGSVDMLIDHGVKGEDVERVYFKRMEGFCFVVPKTKVPNYVYHLVHPFDLGIWVLLLILASVCIILGWIWPGMFPRSIFCYLFFGGSTADYQMKRVERFLLFSLGVLVFLLSEAYLAKLISFILNDPYKRDLRTIEELAASNIPVLGEDEAYPRELYGIKNIITVENMDSNSGKSLMELAYQHGFAYPIECNAKKYFDQDARNFDAETGLEKVYMINSPFQQYIPSYKFHLFGPFRKRFEVYMDRIFESGIIDSFYVQRQQANWTYNGVEFIDVKQQHTADVANTIKFKHLTNVWLVYFIGIGTAFGVLLLEKLLWKMKRK